MQTRRGVAARWCYRGLAYLCLGLGTVGIVTPLLPTTPFLLLALWAAARGSPRLKWRLVRHPRYGPFLRDWHRHRVIPRRAKVVACIALATSWGMLVVLGADWSVRIGVGALFLVLGLYLVTRAESGSGRY